MCSFPFGASGSGWKHSQPLRRQAIRQQRQPQTSNLTPCLKRADRPAPTRMPLMSSSQLRLARLDLGPRRNQLFGLVSSPIPWFQSAGHGCSTSPAATLAVPTGVAATLKHGCPEPPRACLPGTLFSSHTLRWMRDDRDYELASRGRGASVHTLTRHIQRK